jgi:hypothetical protein
MLVRRVLRSLDAGPQEQVPIVNSRMGTAEGGGVWAKRRACDRNGGLCVSGAVVRMEG